MALVVNLRRGEQKTHEVGVMPFLAQCHSP
jgi:hypothetical protein